MAIIKACKISNRPKNTGKQCDIAMVATAMIIAVQSGLKFDDADLADPIAWLTTLIHEKKAFPMFGQKAPIREIANDTEGDQIVTLDDGLKVFLRYGLYNRTFGTTSGGLCYAEALQSFLGSGFDVIEIDQQGQMLARKNSDGTYSPLITDFMYSPSPVLADFKSTPYKNRFQYSYSPVELVNNGIIFKGAEALLSMQGLVDAKITEKAAATAADVTIGVETTCSDEDLVDTIGADLADPANFAITNVATGLPVTITAAAIVGGNIVLSAVLVSGQTYRVVGTSPEVWLANNVEGYDGSENYVDILVP
jgi:hypothetical protein